MAEQQQSNRMPVRFEDVFFHGAYVLAVTALRDFDLSSPDREVQAVDKDTGKPVWVAEVVTGDLSAREKTVKVKIAADVQPVPPETLPGSPFRPVEFEGMSVTPWVDTQRCTGPKKPGESHRCRARQAFSLWATGMRAPSGSKPQPKAGAA